MREKGKKFGLHLLRPYNLFQNNRFLHKIGKKYMEGNFRVLVEQTLFKFRNILWGSPTNLFNTVCIETTSICNRRCSYCPNVDHYRGDHYMSIKLIHKIIDELAQMNYLGKICPHFYGEPLIDKRLPEIISYTKKKLPKSKITIYSNGDLLTVDLFKELIQRGVTAFDITEHGKEMSVNMKKVFAFLEKSPTYKPYLNYKTQIYFDNRGGLVKIDEVTKRKRCFSQSNLLTINYLGDVILCCNDFFGKNVYGNIKKAKISDIWNKPLFKRVRKDLEKGIFKLGICRKCVGLEK